MAVECDSDREATLNRLNDVETRLEDLIRISKVIILLETQNVFARLVRAATERLMQIQQILKNTITILKLSGEGPELLKRASVLQADREKIIEEQKAMADAVDVFKNLELPARFSTDYPEFEEKRQKIIRDGEALLLHPVEPTEDFRGQYEDGKRDRAAFNAETH